MIGSGRAHFQNLDVAFRLLGHADEHVQKILAGDVPRATARHQDSARRKHVDRQPIQPVVRPQGVVDAAAAAGEFRRIGHHAANRCPAAASDSRAAKQSAGSKRTLCKPFNVGVGPGQGDRLLAGIEAFDFARRRRRRHSGRNHPSSKTDRARAGRPGSWRPRGDFRADRDRTRSSALRPGRRRSAGRSR